MHGRTPIRDNQIQDIRTSSSVDAWVERCPSRNRHRNNGLQPKAHYELAWGCEIDARASSFLIEQTHNSRIEDHEIEQTNLKPLPGRLLSRGFVTPSNRPAEILS
jgi:hypothetical protein